MALKNKELFKDKDKDADPAASLSAGFFNPCNAFEYFWKDGW